MATSADGPAPTPPSPTADPKTEQPVTPEPQRSCSVNEAFGSRKRADGEGAAETEDRGTNTDEPQWNPINWEEEQQLQAEANLNSFWENFRNVNSPLAAKLSCLTPQPVPAAILPPFSSS